ncbi:MAG: DNA alkylation repair protein [Eubacterium sp.]|nr:DNA alkylation repair protein [Eubacterium sp.]
MSIIDEIRQELFNHQDKKYRDMQIRIVPSVDPESIIGVRTPILRKYAKDLAKREDVSDFLEDLPHRYFDENQLHAFIISVGKDFDVCIGNVERFLPFVDNWATCDQMSPGVFKKHRPELLKHIREWIRSDEAYTIRFGVGMLMEHFLDEDFSPEYPEMVAGIRPASGADTQDGSSTSKPVPAGSEEYYIQMMIAWYFATALAKQYDAILPYIEEQRLAEWTHNKAIQKSIESYRITPEQKDYLRTLKIKRHGR